MLSLKIKLNTDLDHGVYYKGSIRVAGDVFEISEEDSEIFAEISSIVDDETGEVQPSSPVPPSNNTGSDNTDPEISEECLACIQENQEAGEKCSKMQYFTKKGCKDLKKLWETKED